MGRLFHGWPLVTALVVLILVGWTIGLFNFWVAGLSNILVVILLIGALVRWLRQRR
jgi:hypothetical protein